MKTFPISYLHPSVKTLKTGLISLWEMDDASGAVVDAHGSNNLAVYNGALQNQSEAKLGKSVKLDGSNDYMRYSVSDNRFTPVSAHSVSIWVRRVGNSVDSNGVLVGKMYSATGYRVYYMTILNADFGSGRSNELVYSYYDSANLASPIYFNSGGSDIWTNTWNHVVSTRSGSNMTLYVNGVEEETLSSGNGSGKQSSSTNVHWCLGAHWKSTTQPDTFFNGYIDQTGVWSKALTALEVKELYNGGNGLAYVGWQS